MDTPTPIPDNVVGAREFGSVASASVSDFRRSLLAWDSILFFIVCISDLVSTVVFVERGGVGELNPMLAWSLRQGIACFIAVKLMSFVPTLLVCAWYRSRYPSFITLALRIALVGYLMIYIVGVGRQFAG